MHPIHPGHHSPSYHSIQKRLDTHIAQLQRQLAQVRDHFSTRVADIGSKAEKEFGRLGGRINEVTGYKEVESLKVQVVEKESRLSRLRSVARQAKEAYDAAVTSRSDSQRAVTSLLERKHTWTDADVSTFTSLVRADHASNLAVSQSKLSLVEAELAVEQAFDSLMKGILERYHEEQVWSDKIRSVSTYGSLAVLVVNLVVFLGAIVVVEPWKRKRLVLGLEERVIGMMHDVEGRIEDRIEGEMKKIEKTMTAVQATLSDGTLNSQEPEKEGPEPVTDIQQTPPMEDIPSEPHPTGSGWYSSTSYAIARMSSVILNKPTSQQDKDLIVSGLIAGFLGGGVTVGLTILAMTRK